MTKTDKARLLRPFIEKAAQSLEDNEALSAIEIYPVWKPNTEYIMNVRVRYDGILYKVLQNHTSQASWTPDAAPSLFARVLIPDPQTYPDWVQPDSTNPYSIGDRVIHNNKVWESDYDNNVWEPGVFGWHEVVE